MKTKWFPFVILILYMAISGCEDKSKEACEETKWPQLQERTVEARVKLPPLCIAGTDTLPINEFATIDITGTINKEYCSGEKSGQFDISLLNLTTFNTSDYYTLLPRVNYKFENDLDKVQLNLKIKGTTLTGDVYVSTFDYQSFKPTEIYLDIYNFNYYVTLIFTTQSVTWTKQ